MNCKWVAFLAKSFNQPGALSPYIITSVVGSSFLLQPVSVQASEAVSDVVVCRFTPDPAGWSYFMLMLLTNSSLSHVKYQAAFRLSGKRTCMDLSLSYCCR